MRNGIKEVFQHAFYVLTRRRIEILVLLEKPISYPTQALFSVYLPMHLLYPDSGVLLSFQNSACRTSYAGTLDQVWYFSYRHAQDDYPTKTKNIFFSSSLQLQISRGAPIPILQCRLQMQCIQFRGSCL